MRAWGRVVAAAVLAAVVAAAPGRAPAYDELGGERPPWSAADRAEVRQACRQMQARPGECDCMLAAVEATFATLAEMRGNRDPEKEREMRGALRECVRVFGR